MKSLMLDLHPTWLFSPQVATAVENWKNAIREAQTFSRMHVLLGMLDASIKWDMSAENARCKVCRRKGKDLSGVRKGVIRGYMSQTCARWYWRDWNVLTIWPPLSGSQRRKWFALNLSSSFQGTMRSSSCAMSATRPFTCSVCDQPCTASLTGSGAAWPASLPWPDGAPAQGDRLPHTCIYPVFLKS